MCEPLPSEYGNRQPAPMGALYNIREIVSLRTLFCGEVPAVVGLGTIGYRDPPLGDIILGSEDCWLGTDCLFLSLGTESQWWRLERLGLEDTLRLLQSCTGAIMSNLGLVGPSRCIHKRQSLGIRDSSLGHWEVHRVAIPPSSRHTDEGTSSVREQSTNRD